MKRLRIWRELLTFSTLFCLGSSLADWAGPGWGFFLLVGGILSITALRNVCEDIGRESAHG